MPQTDTLLVTPEGRAVFAGLRDGEGVIVDTKTAFYFGLNRTAAFLWERLQARATSVAELSAALCERFAVDAPDAQRDAAAFVDQVLALGLVVRAPSPEAAA